MSRRTLLAAVINNQLRALQTVLRPATILHYRYTSRWFLAYLGERFPQVHRPDQLRRDPHIFGWMEQLWLHEPKLAASSRLGHLVRLRRLLDGLADLPHPPRPGLIRSEDLPRPDVLLPRPLSIEDDQRLQQQLLLQNDLLSHALLLLRGTGLRLGELVDLSNHCLHPLDHDHWAIQVPVGKLHAERWVPADRSLSDIVANLQWFRALPPFDPNQPFLLPRPKGCLDLMQTLRQTLRRNAAQAGCTIQPVPHQLRHTYATDMIRGGVSLPALMKLLGHTTPRMTLRYVEVTQADLQRAFLQARQHPVHSPPPIPFDAHSGDPLDWVAALQTALRLFDNTRLRANYPTSLNAFRRRLLKLLAAATSIASHEQ
ncbi:MAG: tyrosine-type recombinase/integrase [Bryobacterales bacterium]|nr:tyrosine-type recombinase/integrase [Bryobacterales bacterium]